MDPFSFAMMTVAQIGISYLFPSEGPRLKDLKISASSYGAAIPQVFGLTRVPGNMIWSKPIRERKKKKSAGKGGAYNEYTYFCTFAMGLCKGEVTAIRRVWADNKLIYDGTGGMSAIDTTNALSGGIKGVIANMGATGGTSKYRMRFYMGSEDQMPDSAITENLTEANATAFRGLSYILFDDMPLEDFGNRIPQITAEVLVGDASTSVAVTPLREVDDQYLLDPSYATGESAFDFQRSILYLRYDDTIKAINLLNARARFTYEAFGLPEGASVGRLLCLGPDGAVYVLRNDIGATATLDRLDPYSLQTMQSQPAIPTPVLSVSATGATLDAGRLLTIAADGQARQFRAEDLEPTWSGSVPNAAAVCARDAAAQGGAVFFALGTAGAGQLALTRITAETTEVIHTFSGTAAGPILWDSAAPGVVMFYKAGGIARLAKWSEDTDAEAWNITVAGYPTRMSPATRLLDNQMGWLHDGRLYLVDTMTGAALDGAEPATGEGTPDWNDYLTRYPQVKADYYDGGWAYADSPEAYAQYDYTTKGQAEGRTVTYITSTVGKGVALEDEYEGGMGQTQAMDSNRGVLFVLDGLTGAVKASNIATGVSVGTIVARMLEEGGLALVRTDLTPLYQIPIRGYGWASSTDIKGVLDELRRLYLFDLSEREGQIVARMRGDGENGLGAIVETIPQAALGSSSDSATDFWQETRFQEAELPSSINLTYMNIENDFETTVARSARISNPLPAMFSRQQVAMELNVVLTPKEAKVQTNKMLYAQWAERTKHTTNLPWAYLDLDPGDFLRVAMDDGRAYEERLHQTELGADFTIAAETYAQDSGAYDGWEDITNADGGGAGGAGPIAPPGMALPFVFNTPLLRDQDDQGGSISLYYTGVGDATEGRSWAGAGVFRSLNTFDYDPMPATDQDVEWGTVLGDRLGRPHAGPFAVDWKSKVTIRPAVPWFDLESVTDDDLWAGANLCLIGDEVIQFRDAVENEDGTWTLSHLLRGRRGTEYACETHKNGERFVFLANTTIAFGFEQTSSRGQVRYFKAVASGGSIQDQPALQIIYEPRDLMPYAPTDIRRIKETSGDITLTWARRTRLGGNLQNGTPTVALAEKSERYEAYVVAAPFSGDLSRGQGPGAYRRRFDVTTPTATYTAAMQAEDGFAADADLHLVIYQLSDAVGRGFPGVRSIEPDEAF